MEIKFSDLSKYRGELMGFAMIIVVLFHVGGFRHDTFWYCLSRCGNVGVDLFLFLSGIGLWYAWTKQPSLRHFYWRRYIRIYPAWFIIACIYYIPKYTNGDLTLGFTISEIAINWGFWHHDELNFWFIPSIMMLYTIAPAYMALILRHDSFRWMPIAAIILCFMVQYWQPVHSTVGHLEIFFSRIPIFLLGINAGEWVKQKRTIEPQGIWMLAIIFVMSAIVCINFENGLRGRFPLFIERMAYIPLTISMLLLLCRLFDVLPQWSHKPFVFIGGISLELYLIHIEFVLKPLKAHKLVSGYWDTAIALLIISSILAWLLHKVIDLGVKRLEKARNSRTENAGSN